MRQAPSPRGRAAFRLALAVTAGTIAVLAVSPLPTPSGPEGIDKVEHLAAFALLAALAERGYPGRGTLGARWAWLLGYGVMIEAVQALLPYRDASVADLIANALGILGYSAFAGLLSRLIGRREQAAGPSDPRSVVPPSHG